MGKNKTKKWDAERKKEYDREYYLKNKDKLTAYHKKWQEDNREHVRQYIKDNHDKILAQDQARHAANPEKRTKDWQEWYAKNTKRSVRRRFTDAKNKAINKRKLSWTLTFEEYTKLVSLPCHYCANRLGAPVKRSVGLDRLDSNKGYELSNVVSCCYICNCIKSQFLTSEETRVAANVIVFYRENKLAIILSQKLETSNKDVIIENFGRRFSEGKRMAKRREHEWALTHEEYRSIISKPCYYCEFQLGTPSKVSAGLDRLDSKIGYTKDNVVACCYTCNCIKNDFLTPEETILAVQAILKYRIVIGLTVSQTSQ